MFQRKLILAAIAATIVGGTAVAEESRDEVLERIRPIGTVSVAGQAKPAEEAAPAAEAPAAEAPTEAAPAEAPAAAAATAAVDGAQVYQMSCFACHGTGAAGAPKMGDAAAWAPRIAKGKEALYQSAFNGVPGTAMTPRGGNMSLSDEAVKASVDYMVANSQ